MTQYNKITALYSRLSVGDEDRDGGESNSIVNQKAFLERYARQEKLTNIRHYIDDDESGTYDISGLADAMSKSIEQYGSFPVSIPAIPLISPTEITLKLSADDVDAMRKRIESAV